MGLAASSSDSRDVLAVASDLDDDPNDELRDVEAEQDLIGILLADSGKLDDAMRAITALDFSEPVLSRVFVSIGRLQANGVPTTPNNIVEAMITDADLFEIGGLSYLAELQLNAFQRRDLDDCAGSIAHWAERRKAAEILDRAREDLQSSAPVESCFAPVLHAAKSFALTNGSEHPNTPPQGEPVLDEPLRFIDVGAWEGCPIPERLWAVQDRIPAGNVTLLSGTGGIGKTLIAEQLAVAKVLEKDWLGVIPSQGAAMIICCEDDEDEMHRRFADIADYYGASFSSLRGHLHPLSLAGEDAVIAAPDRGGIIQPTKLYRRILQAAQDVKPGILILDNSADVYAGNENDRAQVRQFIGLLRKIAIAANTSVLLTSHPSLNGITTGSGISGSTAWHASVRARLYMRKPQAEGEDQIDPDERVLEVMKNNYGPAGETITLRWQNGLFVPTAGVHWIDKRAAENATDDLFLRILDRVEAQGRNVSHKRNAPNYAPTVFAEDAEAKGKRIRKAALADAMQRLFTANRLHVATYGRPSRLSEKLAPGAHP